jgi:mannosyltransferase
VLRPAPRPSSRLWWPAPLAGLSAAGLLGWGLATPALWLDEAATVSATQRDWSSLWHLTQASEAPLVPFYALVKVLTVVSPDGTLSPEVLYRLPSVVAACLAVAVLALWLARQAGSLVAVAASGALLLVPSFSRYGQEARPYAVALLCGVLCTVAWSRLVAPPPAPSAPPSRSGRPASGVRWRVAWYALAVAGLALAHLLAVSLVAAHVVLAALDPGETGRRRALRRTLTGAAAGLLLALPLAGAAWANGRGPNGAPREATPGLLADVLAQLATERQPQVAGALVLLAAAAVGVSRLRSARYGRPARVALAWAVVPLVVLVPVMWLRPGLMTHRYLLVVVPGWAVLAGLGLATLAELSRRTAVRHLAVAGALAGLVALQATPLATLRGPAGHGENVRAALAFARADDRAALPLVMPTRSGVMLAPYGRDDEARLLGGRAQRETRSIWPTWDEKALADGPPRLVLLLRGTQDEACRWQGTRRGATATANACMPDALRAQGYVATEAAPTGRRWTAAVLERRPPS